MGSGRGSNAEALLQAEKSSQLGKAEIVGLLTDSETSRFRELANTTQKPFSHIDPGPYRTRMSEEAEHACVNQLKEWNTELVVLAGFMRVVKKPLLDAFPHHIINLHPSLLPKYPGLDAVKRAYEAGESQTGCTVHRVTAEVDAGTIIAQKSVPIQSGESYESVLERVHAAEHSLLPEVVCELSKEHHV